jgi:peptidoglycan/xylan/chitin deacetylase (PgdA/CDA1 family)
MLQVLITVDTECSLGGAWENPSLKPIDAERSVLGKIGSEYYGTPRLMDILEENGLRGAFFVEVFAGLNASRAALTEAYSQIAKRGHDVQLHLHPIHYYYHLREEGRLALEKLPKDKDMFAAHPPEKQVEMLRTGVAIFRDMIGENPIAFRAGNFGADLNTLDALEKVGIRFDSSFNAGYAETDCKLDSGGAINRSWQHGRVWEIPITNFQTGRWGWRGLKQLNINAVSLWEMKSVLDQAACIGLRTVNFIAHSFSLFKVADIQFRKLKPDRLALTSLPGDEKETPNMGMVVPFVRKGVQAVNRIPWI